MENLNAEQIKKALECLTGEPKLCKGCPYDGTEHYPFCREHCAKDALALINSQEQRIEELAIANEHLAVFLAEAKADTVRKMQERLKRECFVDSGWEVFQRGTIDQIAKEMLESEDG